MHHRQKPPARSSKPGLKTSHLHLIPNLQSGQALLEAMLFEKLPISERTEQKTGIQAQRKRKTETTRWLCPIRRGRTHSHSVRTRLADSRKLPYPLPGSAPAPPLEPGSTPAAPPPQPGLGWCRTAGTNPSPACFRSCRRPSDACRSAGPRQDRASLSRCRRCSA